MLVIRGKAGIGKTALMRYCARQASGCRPVQVAGVESEMALPFAALHQFCGPMLGGLDALPEPQQRALRVAFGLAAALAVAEPASEETRRPYITQWVLPELIEAAVRTGRTAIARAALGRLSAMTVIEGSDWAKGLEARSRALVREGRGGGAVLRRAVERLGRTPLRPELARAHLLYGEWLRRETRRVDARHQLHAAYNLFTAIGAEAFAERARRAACHRRESPQTRG